MESEGRREQQGQEGQGKGQEGQMEGEDRGRCPKSQSTSPSCAWRLVSHLPGLSFLHLLIAQPLCIPASRRCGGALSPLHKQGCKEALKDTGMLADGPGAQDGVGLRLTNSPATPSHHSLPLPTTSAFSMKNQV